MTPRHRSGGPSVSRESPTTQPDSESKGQVWDCYLLTAGTSDGQPFQIMPIVDERSEECLATVVERNISAEDVTNRLFDLFVLRGTPECIRSSNGAGSMAKAIDSWLRQAGVETHSVKGNSRTDNGGESFGGKLKDELIEKTTFATLPEAKAAIEGWRQLHNETLRRHAKQILEASQSPRLERSSGHGAHGVNTPAKDSAIDQVELTRVAGLRGSPDHLLEAIQSVPTHDSLADEPSDGQFAPWLDSPLSRIELNQTAGPSSSYGSVSDAPLVVLTGQIPSLESDGRSVPPKNLPIGQVELTVFQAKVMLARPRWGEGKQSVKTGSTGIPGRPPLMVAKVRMALTSRLIGAWRRRSTPRN